MSSKHPTKTTKILKTVPTVAMTETGHTRMSHLKEPMEVELRPTTPEKLCGVVTSVVNTYNFCIIKNILAE